jgi:hypothetical protein
MTEEKVSVIFGGRVFDLRSKNIPEGGTVSLEIFALCAGIKIIVPQEWLVQASLRRRWGGFSNATVPPRGKPQGTLMLKGAVIFSGVYVSSAL